MEPFNITNLGPEAYKRYPSPLTFLDSISDLSHDEMAPYLRLHLFEGAPYFLRDKPLVYEMGREWLSCKLNVLPRDILVIGSSSIGFSMAPPPDFGRFYTEKSDIDLAIISNGLFERLVNVFLQWKSDYEDGIKIPKQAEVKYWNANKVNVVKNIERGFIDTYKIPNQYEQSSRVNDSLWQLGEKIQLTIGQVSKVRVSLRVYRDWQSFFRQFKINVDSSISKIDDNHRALLALNIHAN
ncbi:MAG: hypothetical protein PHC94_05255 [Methylobacter sp.]|nr:hypothetical protein [Methylobacter sp.]